MLIHAASRLFQGEHITRRGHTPNSGAYDRAERSRHDAGRMYGPYTNTATATPTARRNTRASQRVGHGCTPLVASKTCARRGEMLAIPVVAGFATEP